MNTFYAVLAALLVRDVAYEGFSIWRIRRSASRLLQAMRQERDYQPADDEAASIEEFLKHVANQNRTQKD